MASTPTRTAGLPVQSPPADRLDSWKEIAVYLKRAERTVRRWEGSEGLPVHRHVHEKRGSVYAYRTELDVWWNSRARNLEGNGGDRRAPWKLPWGRLGTAALLATLIVAAAGVIAWHMVLRKAPKEALNPGRVTTPSLLARGNNSILVLPFVDLSPDRGEEYFADGLTEELIDSLTQVPGLDVVARTSAFQFKGKTLDVREIGQRMNVAIVLEGSVRRSGNQLRITVQLNKSADGYHLWSKSYDREVKDAIAVQQEIARAIVNSLQPKLAGGFVLEPARPPTPSAEVYELYLRGRYFYQQFSSAGYDQARRCFDQALAKDPNYAPAYVGLADLYLAQGGHLQVLAPQEAAVKAREALAKALQLSQPWWEAHLTLGRLKSEFEWDWAGAEKEYQRAIELNPGSQRARSWYGRFLARRGRLDESLRERETALRLDPLSPDARIHVADSLYCSRRYDDAIEQCRKILELHPRSWAAYGYLAASSERMGRYREALAAVQESLALNADEANLGGLSWLGYVSAMAGDKAEAQKVLDRLTRESRQRYVSPMLSARVCVSLGLKGRALEYLEEGYRKRDPMMLYLKDPILDPLHSDQRYEALLRRMAL